MALNAGNMRKGWRFSPTDEELITDFLKKKNEGLLPDIPEIPVLDVCKFEPWDLPSKSLLGSNDLQWFFFSPCKWKYHRGHRKNRMTREGYWKATGKDRNIKSQSSKLIGKKRTLVFYQRHAPCGKRTYWIMHEYQLIENVEDGRQGLEGVFVICRLKTKSDESLYWNSGNECNDTSSVFSSVDSHVREALQSTGTPSDQVTLNPSRMQAGKVVAGEHVNEMVFPPVLQKEPGKNHTASFLENHEDALELQFLVEACRGTDFPQSLSPLTSSMDEDIGEFCYTLIEQDCLCTTAMNTSFLGTQADMTAPASNDVHGCLLDSPARETVVARIMTSTLDEEPDKHPIRFSFGNGKKQIYHSSHGKSDSDKDSDESISGVCFQSGQSSRSAPPSEFYQRFYLKDPSHSVNQKFLVKSKENKTGIKIRRRQRTYRTNLSKCVDKGTAPQRVLSLQKIRDCKVSDIVCGLSDNADNSEIKSAAPGGWINGEAVMTYMYEEQEGLLLSEITRRLRNLKFAEKSQNRLSPHKRGDY